MITTDFHVHTNISVDSPASMADMIEGAIQRGFTEIAITDHVDHNPADDGAGMYDPVIAYNAALAAQRVYGGRITIRPGAELGEPHLYTRQNHALYQLPLDVIIGSIHCMGPYGVHSDLFDNKSLADALKEYFDLVLTMAREADIDILGHLDYFERYTTQRGLPAYDPRDYRDPITNILSTIIDRGIALEINTSSFRSQLSRPFPGPEVLDWYYRMGGRLISIGSDAHRPEHFGTQFDELPRLLGEIGFREYHVYRSRKPVAIPLA